MIGKLQVWRGERGEQRKEALAQDKMRVGGFVSFDELDRKLKDASTAIVAPAKKVNTNLW